LRLPALIALVCCSAAATSCGGGSSKPSASTLGGNWQITLVRHNSTEPWDFSGFLLQSGKAVSGSVILGAGTPCVSQTGPVTGSVDGSNVELTIGSLGQDFSLTGTMAPGSGGSSSMSGQFSTLVGSCLGFSSAGSWTAVQVSPLSSPFHGSFIGTIPGSTTPISIDVSGNLTQGPNIGASNATLSGTFSASGAPQFCPYLTTGTLTGIISGTGVRLNIFAPDGTLVGQVPELQTKPGATPQPPATLTIAPDGIPLKLKGGFSVESPSSDCPQLNGDAKLFFP
jgi:hypothetical protein